MRLAELAEAVSAPAVLLREFGRGDIGDDKRLGYVIRRAAREGTSDDLLALVRELREHLRR